MGKIGIKKQLEDVVIGKNDGVAYNVAGCPCDHLRFRDGTVQGTAPWAFGIVTQGTFCISCRSFSVAYPPQIPVCCTAWEDCTGGRRVCSCRHWVCRLHSRRQFTNDTNPITIIVCRHCPQWDNGAMYDGLEAREPGRTQQAALEAETQ